MQKVFMNVFFFYEKSKCFSYKLGSVEKKCFAVYLCFTKSFFKSKTLVF